MRGRMRRVRGGLARAPLSTRLVAGTLLLVALALTATGLLGTGLLHSRLMARADIQVSQAADRAHSVSPKPLRMTARGLFEPRHKSLSLMYVAILDERGQLQYLVAEHVSGDRPALPPLTAETVARRHQLPFTVGSATGSGAEWRVMAKRQLDGTTRVAAVSLADVDNTVSSLAAIDAGVGAVVLLVLGFAGYALVRASMRPLAEIEGTAATIAAGDLTQRVPEHDVPVEVGRLGAALNGMLAQIESAFRDREASAAAARRSEERMRRFVADASHELRTPLTSIRGFAELYRQESAGRPGADPEAAKVLRRIEEDAARMGLLVEDLLLLARMDQQRPLEAQPVDLLSLAADAVLDAQALAPDREIDLARLDDSDLPVTVIGDEVRLRQVVSNLITNVLTHTPPGTTFQVRIGITGRGAVLEVADEGPGLSGEQAGRVFERFYRAESSRSRARGGSGLGLSIVLALVQAHRGTVELETAPGEGAVFRVVLPITPPRPAR